MDDSERKKVVELLQEMRNTSEIETNKVGKQEDRLNWMYKGSSDLVNREDYLLGKSIDKSFEILNSGGNSDACLGRTSEQSNVPKRLLEKTDNTDQVDIAKKILEDPLYAIKQKEMEARKQLLNNPVKLKQIRQMLLERSKKKELRMHKKKKSKKKELPIEKLNFKILQLLRKFNDKEKRKALKKVMESDSDYTSSDNSSVKFKSKKTHKNLKKRKKRSHSSSSSESDSDSDSIKKSKKSENYKKAKRKKKESRERSKERKKAKRSSSSSSDSSHDNKKKKHSSNKGTLDSSQVEKVVKHKKSYKNVLLDSSLSSSCQSTSSSSSDSSTSSSSSDSYSDNEKKVKKHKSINKSKTNKEVSENRNAHKKSSDRRKNKDKQNNESKESKYINSLENIEKHGQNYGLMMPDGTRPTVEKRSTVERKYKKPVEIKKKYVPQPKPKPLSKREQEKRLKEMIEDAKLHKKEREKNISHHRKMQAREEENKSYDDDFMRRQMSHLTSQGTMADRIKSNINNIQRSKSSMNSSFMRK